MSSTEHLARIDRSHAWLGVKIPGSWHDDDLDFSHLPEALLKNDQLEDHELSAEEMQKLKQLLGTMTYEDIKKLSIDEVFDLVTDICGGLKSIASQEDYDLFRGALDNIHFVNDIDNDSENYVFVQVSHIIDKLYKQFPEYSKEYLGLKLIELDNRKITVGTNLTRQELSKGDARDRNFNVLKHPDYIFIVRQKNEYEKQVLQYFSE